MVSIECPRCRKRYQVPSYMNDFVCQCDDFPIVGKAVSQEDLPLNGLWTDYTGSSVSPEKTILNRGSENLLQGTRPEQIDHLSVGDFNERGKRASTNRSRSHEEHINIK